MIILTWNRFFRRLWRTRFRKFQFRCRNDIRTMPATVNYKSRQTKWAAYSRKVSAFIFGIFILRREIIRRHTFVKQERRQTPRYNWRSKQISTNHLNVIKVDYNDNSHGSPALARTHKNGIFCVSSLDYILFSVHLSSALSSFFSFLFFFVALFYRSCRIFFSSDYYYHFWIFLFAIYLSRSSCLCITVILLRCYCYVQR